MNDFV